MNRSIRSSSKTTRLFHGAVLTAMTVTSLIFAGCSDDGEEEETSSTCNGETYNSATHFCHAEVLYEKCGGESYENPTAFVRCHQDRVPVWAFVDNRDDQTYEYVKIGTQYWLAENLNYETETGSWCYDENEENCDRYGRLYDWVTVMDIAETYYTTGFGERNNHRGLCPAGWHLPTTAEWSTLTSTVGSASTGAKLKSDTDWNGTNEFGFSALPGGTYGITPSLVFGQIGTHINFWHASEYESGRARRSLLSAQATYGVGNTLKTYANYVRCVRN